ncbi:hypothetical protein [Paenibacillus urinalis]|uniref:hypothetical protein n=1 Tax=Paenibacillus urinalis TaxID=521520 RepID=UPI00195FAF3A
MRKRLTVITLLAIASTIGLSLINVHGDRSTAEPVASKHINYRLGTTQARMPIYNNLSMLEELSDFIVVGHVSGEQGTYQVKAGNGEVIEELGKTPFSIDTVIKGKEILEENNRITVMEDGRFHEGIYYNLEGYVKMNDLDSYLLFLRNTGENTYAINGSYQGKFNINQLNNNVLEFESSHISAEQLKHAEYIGDDVHRHHYNELKDQVRQKYSGMLD